MTRNNTVLAWMSLVLALFGFSSIASATKIGVIDMQKAIQETAQGKKAKKELEDEFNKMK